MSDISPLRRAMRISDWTFVLALPTTERQFHRARAVGEYCVGDDQIGYGGWRDYKERFLSHFEQRIVPLEKRLSLRLLRGATLRRYGQELRDTRGVILFSHCNRDKRSIEFADGMKSYEEIAGHLPCTFAGIADCSACNPVGLDLVLRARAPLCAIRTVTSDLNPAMWFLFYAYFLLSFAKADCSYATALLSATSLLKGARSGKEATAAAPADRAKFAPLQAPRSISINDEDLA
jgi:hypothetical protein